MLKRSKLTSAVAIAIGGAAVAVSSAQAGVLYFPQVASSSTVTTIVSVINTQQGTTDAVNAKEQLHYIYYYKEATAEATPDSDAFNALECVEVNVSLPTSYNDIQSIDLAGNMTDGVRGVLFDDPSFNNDWDTGTNDFALGRDLDPHRGVLIVEHGSGMTAASTSTAGLYGEAIVFDWQSGASWGYQGFANTGGQGVTQTAGTQYDFTSDMSASASNVALFPFEDEGAFATKFMVTPQFSGFDTPNAAPGSRNSNTATIWLEAASDPSEYVAYDRDETPISGSLEKSITCVGAVRAEDLMTGAAADRLLDGGWTGVKNKASFDLATTLSTSNPECNDASNAQGFWKGTCESASIVFKVEYGTTADIQAGGDGVYNNGIYLRPNAWGQNELDEIN